MSEEATKHKKVESDHPWPMLNFKTRICSPSIEYEGDVTNHENLKPAVVESRTNQITCQDFLKLRASVNVSRSSLIHARMDFFMYYSSGNKKNAHLLHPAKLTRRRAWYASSVFREFWSNALCHWSISVCAWPFCVFLALLSQGRSTKPLALNTSSYSFSLYRMFPAIFHFEFYILNSEAATPYSLCLDR